MNKRLPCLRSIYYRIGRSFLTSAIYINLVILATLRVRSTFVPALFRPIRKYPFIARYSISFGHSLSVVQADTLTIFTLPFNFLDIVYWTYSVESFRPYLGLDKLGIKRRLTEWPIMALVGILD